MGTVVDASTNQPLNAVSVVSGQLSATTDSTGKFSLADISQGTQQITFSITGYSTSTVTANITAAPIINLGTIGLSVNPTTGIIQGIVTDVSNGQPLSGATIQVSGVSGQWSATTATDGSYRITGITPEALPSLQTWQAITQFRAQGRLQQAQPLSSAHLYPQPHLLPLQGT